MSDRPVPLQEYKKALTEIKLPANLKPYLISKITEDRTAKRALTVAKIKKTERALKVLKKIPLIWYIGLTGSLSMDNPDEDSDVDLMLIVHPYTLWIVRPLIVFMLMTRHLPIRFSGSSKVKDAICINLYLDAKDLAVAKSKRNFYVAHEILQIVSLFDRGGQYQSLLQSNTWVQDFFANAYVKKRRNEAAITENKVFSPLLKVVNFLLYIAQKTYMSGKITNETVSLTQAFFHPHNPYKRLKARVGLE
jgi:hypothetical protein